MSSLSAGSLLVASPEIDEDIFHRAIILLCEHGPLGSFGVVINKPTTDDLPPELSDIDHPHLNFRQGGPIQRDQMMLLHNCADMPEETLCVTDGVYLGGDADFLQKSLERPDPVLITFGYMGWGEGQLEQEFLAGLWFLHPARSDHVFTDETENLWRTVLREMGGKYASLAMIPEDLSLN